MTSEAAKSHENALRCRICRRFYFHVLWFDPWSDIFVWPIHLSISGGFGVLGTYELVLERHSENIIEFSQGFWGFGVLLTAEYDSVWKSSKLFTFGVPKSDQKGAKIWRFSWCGFEVEKRRLRERVKWVNSINIVALIGCVLCGPQRLPERGLYAVLFQTSLYGPRIASLCLSRKCSKEPRNLSLCHCRFWS